MQDRIQIKLVKAIELANELYSVLEASAAEPELMKTFYVPVFNMLLEGSRFLKTNLNIVLTRYTQRKVAGKMG